MLVCYLSLHWVSFVLQPTSNEGYINKIRTRLEEDSVARKVSPWRFPFLLHDIFSIPTPPNQSWIVFCLYVFKKLPTYPSPKATFCPEWEVSVDVGLGEG